MRSVVTIREMRALVRGWHQAGEGVAFVPTMGGLHEGHLRLADEARSRSDRVVFSVFVNPLQFNDRDDFEAYPRRVEQDRQALAERGVHALFTPTVEELYPRGLEAATHVEVPGLSDALCGAYRPGHFVGVATVVTVLLNIVQPDVAVFGEKDFQQLLIIRRLVDDLHMPVSIVGAPTTREVDGLAMSSRNQYLDDAQRRVAPVLYEALCEVRDEILAGRRDYEGLQTAAMGRLQTAGFRPEYVSVRRADDLSAPGPDDRGLIVLAAAWLGSARLIDNIRVVIPS